MKKGNIELKPITEAQVFDPPKRMYCWNAMNGHPVKACVVAILPKSSRIKSNVICTPTYCNYEFCAEIPKAESRRVTTRELNEWLAKGCGERKDTEEGFISSATIWYNDKSAEMPVGDCYKVRKWCDKEWNEPTAEYLGLKEAEQ